MIRFVNPFVTHRAIKYPTTVPTVFVIISFISVVLNVKICDISMNSVAVNPANATLFNFLNVSHNTGKKKPNGTNKSILRHAFVKSDTIPAKGIIFTPRSIFKEVTFGKPTSAKIAVRYNPNTV